MLPCRIRLLPSRAEFDRLRVVLVASRNSLNIGAAARAMSNFGFFDLRVVNPYEIAFRQAQSAVGAAELLKRAVECKTVGEAVADCTLVVGTTAGARRQPQHPLRGLEEGGRAIEREMRLSGRVALLFGSEKRGLSNDDFSHCHWLMRIPTREEHPSMNLAQAVAVCLYELARDGRPPGKTRAGDEVTAQKARQAPRATAGDAERIASILLRLLRASGYIKARNSVTAEEKMRRLVRRLSLSTQDAAVLVGMLRQIEWKVEGRAAEAAEEAHVVQGDE